MRRSDAQGSLAVLRENRAPRKVLRQLAERRTLPPKHKARISVQALQGCLDLSETPMVVLNKQGSALFCNASFRAFVLQETSLSKVPRTREDSLRYPKREDAVDCSPDVNAWLDSSTVVWSKYRIALQPIRIGREEVTAYSIVSTEPEEGTSLEKEFLHGVINAASSVQILMDLAEEAPVNESSRECLKHAQDSMQQLLLKIAHEATLLNSAGLPVYVRDIFELFISYYKQLPRSDEYRIEIQDDALDSRMRIADLVGIRILDRMLDAAVGATGNGAVLKLASRRIGEDVELRVQCPEEVPPHIRKKILGTFLAEMAPGGMGAMRLHARHSGNRVSIHFDKRHGTTLAVRCFAVPDTPVLKRGVESADRASDFMCSGA